MDFSCFSAELFCAIVAIGQQGGDRIPLGNRQYRENAMWEASQDDGGESCSAVGVAEFDSYAEGYDGGMDHPLKRMIGSSAEQFMEIKARRLLRRRPELCQQSRLKLLDYGCGVGTMLQVLRRLGVKAELYGSDPSSKMLDEARSRWPTSLGAPPPFVLQRGGIAPFADNSFDVVVVSAVLHHVPLTERPGVYREINRLLRCDGWLYVFEHNPGNPVTLWFVAHTPIDKNAILLSPGEVRRCLQGIAACDLHTEHFMFFPPILRWLDSLDRSLRWLPLGGQYLVAARKMTAQPTKKKAA
jgi:ubiquinone/menaquinone biosynthesis C-methylase UbiE